MRTQAWEQVLCVRGWGGQKEREREEERERKGDRGVGRGQRARERRQDLTRPLASSRIPSDEMLSLTQIQLPTLPSTERLERLGAAFAVY